MFAMIRHHLQRHTYKVAIGLPVVVLLASSLSFMRSTEQVCLVPEDNRYVEVGEEVILHVTAESDEPVNVLSGIIHVPTDMLTLEKVDIADSIITIWVEEPRITNTDGQIRFSGGIVDEDGFTGIGNIFSVTVRPKNTGTAIINFDEGTMLAHDGTGREVACTRGPITLSVRPASFSSPDVNNDGQVNIFDFSIVTTRIFMPYNPRYDLNSDGRVTFTDAGIVISNMGTSGALSGLAIFSW